MAKSSPRAVKAGAAKPSLNAFLSQPKKKQRGIAAWNRWPAQLLSDIRATIEHNTAHPEQARGFEEFVRDWVKPTYGIEATRMEVYRYLKTELNRSTWTKL